MSSFPGKTKNPTGVEREEPYRDCYGHAKTTYTNQSPQTESHADSSRMRLNSQCCHQRESGVTQVMLQLVRWRMSHRCLCLKLNWAQLPRKHCGAQKASAAPDGCRRPWQGACGPVPSCWVPSPAPARMSPAAEGQSNAWSWTVK